MPKRTFAPAFFDDLWRAIAGGVWRGELGNTSRRAAHSWADTTIVPVLDHHGVPCQYIAIGTDITQAKHIAGVLALSERQNRDAADNLNEVVFRADAQGDWTYLNPARRRRPPSHEAKEAAESATRPTVNSWPICATRSAPRCMRSWE